MQTKHRAIWIVALLAPLALVTLFLLSRPPSSSGTDVVMVPERPNAELPRPTEPVALAGVSAGPSNEQVDPRSTVDPALLAGAAPDTAPYDVHFQVVWKFAPQREPGALVRPSKGALEFSVAGLGWERIPPVEVGHGPRAKMKLWAPASYELRVKEAETEFTYRLSQFGLDASGRVVNVSGLLSVAGDAGHEVITVAVGRRLEITPQRLRELRAVCDLLEIVFEGNGLRTHVIDSPYDSVDAYARDLESLSSQGSNVRVYAPEGAKLIGRSNEDYSRKVTLDVGAWFQE